LNLSAGWREQLKIFQQKVVTLKKSPMVKMMAGGVSWKNELETIEETKKALVENDLWSFAAWQYYQIRKIRTKLKIILHKLGLGKTIKLWRDRKWSS
jgi:hypothetical protein